MRKIIFILIVTYLSSSVQAQDWKDVAVPAEAAQGYKWELQPAPSDDFNYTFTAVKSKSNFGEDKWYNFYHNGWNGPGTTYWQYDHVSVDGSDLVIKSSRNPSTSKMGVPGVNAGCITSNNKVKYPVFVESSVSVANITLASDVWLLSPDDTQEIDIIECYGGADNGNAFFAKFIHLSHHSFIRNPFQDYQPRDLNSWWERSGVSSWGEYAWNNGERKYIRIGVNWISPIHFEYYIDGERVRVMYDKAFATKKGNTWFYTYPSMTNGQLDFENGYQKITQHATGNTYSFQTLETASNASSTSVIDPYNYQNGNGYTKELDIIINVESQDWHVEADRTPTDAELNDPNKNTMKVDWIRVYKPVVDPNYVDKEVNEENNEFVLSADDPASSIRIYPNPANDTLHVQSSLLIRNITILQIDGKKIGMEQINSKNKTLNISLLNAGTYLLNINYSNGQLETKRIVVR
ncbi:T9SS type A sorting domain-containing protein [Reichenbachiella carrageenanivorans]|uniref:T9SS type A sorting domain-containing protein n=1 Tax=Reichenbachiella carrageenanivorans TaxID=2979869 RepID=A0ABY6CYF9_9BACT|nr:T9SS type A sorting domain-containing protein [Reichenbachiella carrageenanivorans]UXX77863.1 T9SS type A sorting domain-containing protein [Reichenbachiella carrageenanivorans]